MCGIAGKLIFDRQAEVKQVDIDSMLNTIEHRGPDGRGIYLDHNVGLGHCRLSIIDVQGGSQPMANEDQTIWIVFNGEIYNFQELRNDLLSRGHVFRSKTDTEVIIHLYEEHGAECLKYLRGMFAFAIWDSVRRSLFVVRDRVGIKPLYYAYSANALYFASELKAIIADPSIPRDIDLDALRQSFSFYYTPGEGTLFKAIRKLLPGHYFIADRSGFYIAQYWDLQFTQIRSDRSFEDCTEELRELLRARVHDHMIADVPVGLLLSGGLDSSAMLSLAASTTRKPINTFTIGFDDEAVVDERPFARLAASRFGSEHHEISIGARDFWSYLPDYIWHMEEPVCEPPAVALHYVSQLARRKVKVLLSGEGGDEAFAGYPNYPNMLRLNSISKLFGPFSKTFGACAAQIGKSAHIDALHRYGSALGSSISDCYFSRSSDPTRLFNRLDSPIFTPAFLAATQLNASHTMHRLLTRMKARPILDQLLYADTKLWLPDDLLVKADKITMGNSLELRVPLLDHTILEFAASLPAAFKVRGRETKRILKAVFLKELPSEIIFRKKAGFPVPYNTWLRKELMPELTNILVSGETVRRGYLVSSEISRLLNSFHTSGRFAKEIFSLLVTELWFQRFASNSGAPAPLALVSTEQSSVIIQKGAVNH